MSQKLQPVRGTHDLFFKEAEKFRHVVDTARSVGELYGFREMHTPIFEFTEVFKRTLGETSDVVNKEMYTFEDRGGESITLRPEFTAGIARAFISNGLQQHLPLKFFSYGPLFRYERPQKGRQRQFHQVNFEWFGAKGVASDFELIKLASDILSNLHLKNIVLEINSLGDEESRKKYREALVSYFSKYEKDLSEDSKKRLAANPLRILDSKDEGDRKIVSGAPSARKHYTDASIKYFDALCAMLKDSCIEYKVNEKIVRGLDYYSQTVFEFISHDAEMGAQNTVLAGGRYDSLVKSMGGPDTPAIGFAAGLERLMLLMKSEIPEKKPITIITSENQKASQEAFRVAADLRKNKRCVEVLVESKLGKGLEKASKKFDSTFAVIIMENEVANNKVLIKNLRTSEQQEVEMHHLLQTLLPQTEE